MTKTRMPTAFESGRRPPSLRSVKAAVSRPEVQTPGQFKLVGAVDGAIRILRHLSTLAEPAGVSRIAKETGLNTSTAFNILRTLALRELVHFDPQAKTYALGLGIMEIARGASALGSSIDLLRPALEDIAHRHGVTVTLWQPVSRSRKVLMMSALNRNAIRIQMALGQRLPILTGATGRIFGAFGGYNDSELKARFDEVRWDQPLSFKDFREQVGAARKNGWAIDDGNFASGTISLAVPILGREGQAGMAITVTMFAGQFAAEKVEDIVGDLKRFAEQARRHVVN